jgi:hypothetical protein
MSRWDRGEDETPPLGRELKQLKGEKGGGPVVDGGWADGCVR